MTTDDCRDPHEVDAAWLGLALEQAGVARGATLTHVDFGGFVGTGQTGCNARYHLTWDDPEGRPATVVGKFPSMDPQARANGFDGDTYRNEWEFYSSLVHTLDVRAPHCYSARLNLEERKLVLLMEDLAGSRQGDQFHGLTPDEAVLAVEQAVGLHAPRWGDPDLRHFAAHRPKGAEWAARIGEVYALTMEPFLARLGAGLDDDVVRLVRDFAPLVSRWALGTGTPRTVVHFDFRPDNFMFGVEPGAPPLAVVDWQTCTEHLAMIDLAYLFGGCFEPHQRAEVERGLLGEYHDRLAAAGVAYDPDDLWRDYRFASLWGVAMSVIAAILAAETERGNAMLTVMAQRAGRHALDLEALALLR